MKPRKQTNFRKPWILLPLVLCIVLLFMGCSCRHKKITVATCTEPSICVKCGKTIREPLDHKASPWCSAYVDAVSATEIFTKTCVDCGELMDQNIQELNTLHDGETFLFSPVEFVDRFNAKLAALEDNFLEATLEDVNGRYGCVILADGVFCGSFVFSRENSSIGEEEQDEPNSICQLVAAMEDDEACIVRALIALVQTCDPSLTDEDAAELVNALTSEGFLYENGIDYVYNASLAKPMIAASLKD